MSECPKYLETTLILAPLLINKEAQLCLKSCNRISLTPARSATTTFLLRAVEYGIGVIPYLHQSNKTLH